MRYTKFKTTKEGGDAEIKGNSPKVQTGNADVSARSYPDRGVPSRTSRTESVEGRDKQGE